MKNLPFILLLAGLTACNQPLPSEKKSEEIRSVPVREEAQRAWNAYKTYAWGHDVLKPLSKSYSDWYSQTLYISPIDAYSTLKVIGMEDEAARVEHYIVDSTSFDKDIFVKTFEVNIRVHGGLVSMYQYTGNEMVLTKAKDFGNRLLPAFHSGTGIPHYWVNLKTGQIKGDTVNVAEAGTYLLEMGALSYFTGDPAYYQAAKKATMAIHQRRTALGLVPEVINVETGEWLTKRTHIGACIDSYYEYLYKAWLLFGDPELHEAWETSIAAINRYIAQEADTSLWYGQVDAYTGELISGRITLYDAFFPALLALSGDLPRAEKLQVTWDGIWNLHGLEPMAYDYLKKEITYPVYDLNPEIIESAYYLSELTGDPTYRNMAGNYWNDILAYCRTDAAFTVVTDVVTKEKGDEMATYFLAETLKYLFLALNRESGFIFRDYVFTTEAHPLRKDQFDQNLIPERLGFSRE